jgi:hypothetical protein
MDRPKAFAGVPVGGHCCATFQIAHMKEYGYLRVSGVLLLRCLSNDYRYKIASCAAYRALPRHVSSIETIMDLRVECKDFFEKNESNWA